MHTATDYAVAGTPPGRGLGIGEPSHIPESVYSLVKEYEDVLRSMLEGVIDRMKTNPDDINVLLVGGVCEPNRAQSIAFTYYRAQ